MVFHFIIHLDEILAWIKSKHAGRGAWSFCAPYWFLLNYALIFLSMTLSHKALFFYRTVLGCTGYVFISALSPTPWDTAVGYILVTDSVCYHLSGHVLFGQDQLLCHCPCTTSLIMSYHSEWNAECLSLTDSFFVLLIFLFQLCINFRIGLSYNRVLFPYNLLFLMWLFLQMLHTTTRPFIFRVLIYLSPILVPGQIPCVGFI